MTYTVQVERVTTTHHTSWHLDLDNLVVGEGIDASSREKILCSPSSVQDLEEHRDGWGFKADTVDREFSSSLEEFIKQVFL